MDGEPPFPVREDSRFKARAQMPERKFFKLKVENGKLKIAVGQTVCKMQIIVTRLFLYIQKLRLNVWADAMVLQLFCYIQKIRIKENGVRNALRFLMPTK